MPETTKRQDGRGRNPNSALHRFTRENAREMQARSVTAKLTNGELQELAEKAFGDREAAVTLARVVSCKIMANESEPSRIRLEAAAPFLKQAGGNVAIQINVGSQLDKRAEMVQGAPPAVVPASVEADADSLVAEPVAGNTTPEPTPQLYITCPQCKLLLPGGDEAARTKHYKFYCRPGRRQHSSWVSTSYG